MMMKPGFRKSRKGSALLEFAIIAPMMVGLMFGVIDYSRIFYYGELAAGAARSGTEYALLSTSNAGDTSGMQTAATNDASLNTTTTQAFTAVATNFCQCASTTSNVPCTTDCGAGTSLWHYAQVHTTLTFSTLFHYYVLPSTVTVAGNSVVRVQ